MKRSIALLGVATACLLWTTADAKEIIESRSGDSIKGTRGFDVEEDLRNDQANFRVRVWVDRKDRTYAKGELMRVSVESTESGYLYLIYKQADGSTKCLFPNRFEEDNRIEAGKVVTIPTARQSFRLRCNEPFGDELLVAVVSKKPLAVQKLGAKSLTDDIATKVNLETLAKNLAKGMVVEGDDKPMKPGDYAEHSVSITTVPRRGNEKPRQRRLGLFVGISEYKDDRIRDLSICHKDAIEMARVMEKHGRLDALGVLVNEEATLDAIKEGFRELKLKSRPGDEIFIYWSGHGATCADTGGDEQDGLDEYLMVHDGDLDDVEGTMVMDDALGRWVQELDGRKVTLILDACHSGGQATAQGDKPDKAEKGISGLKGGIIQDVRQKKTSRNGGSSMKGDDTSSLTGPVGGDFLDDEWRGVKDVGQSDAAMLVSSKPDEISAERRDGTLSVMTYYLVQKVVQSDSVTLQQAFEYVSGKVPGYMEEHFPGRTQTPQLYPEGGASQVQLK